MIIETKIGKLPVRYGWGALAKFGDYAGLKMDDVLELDLNKLSITDDVADLLDDDPSIVGKIMDAFSEMVKEGGEDKKK